MKLVQERDINRSGLVRRHGCEGNNKPFLPGDLVGHQQDRLAAGTIISVSGDPRQGDDVVDALVLWTRLPFNGNYPRSSEPTHMAQILKLQEQQMISKEYALRAMGYDPNERPDE